MHSTPDAMLLTSPNCPHCSSVQHTLNELLKDNKLGRLDIINIAAHSEIAAELGARSVPWIKIGYYELTGNYSPTELTDWVNKATNNTGTEQYISELLSQQQLDKAVAMAIQYPALAQALVALSAEPATPMVTRIGVSAMMEALADSETLAPLVAPLTELTKATDPNIRADACHYLGLSGVVAAIPVLESMLQDPHEHVREIAGDSLDRLNSKE